MSTSTTVRDLEEAGVDRKQAEAHSQAVTKHVLPNVATSADIERLMTVVEKAEFRLKVVIVSTAGVVIAAIKFFPSH